MIIVPKTIAAIIITKPSNNFSACPFSLVCSSDHNHPTITAGDTSCSNRTAQHGAITNPYETGLYPDKLTATIDENFKYGGSKFAFAASSFTDVRNCSFGFCVVKFSIQSCSIVNELTNVADAYGFPAPTAAGFSDEPEFLHPQQFTCPSTADFHGG